MALKKRLLNKNRYRISKVFAGLLLMIGILPQVLAQDRKLDEITFEEYMNADSVQLPRLHEWRLDLLTLDTVHLKADTLQNNFFNYNPIYRTSISNNYLGNLGSPYQSNLYFDRPETNEFVFLDVYRDYAAMPEDIRFINTHTPYTNLTYYTGGARTEGEDELIVKHSQNFSPDFNITGVGDYIYGRGMYDNTSTKHLAVSFYASYIKPKYVLHAVATSNSLENFENGGLTDDRYVNDPYSVTDTRGMNETATFPVALSNTISSIKNKYVFINHKYNIGYHKELILADTVLQKFIPVTSIGHTFKYSTYRRMFTEDSSDDFFADQFLNSVTSDSISRNILNNRISINLFEGLNKYVPFGLSIFLENDIIRDGNNSWNHIADSSWNKPYATALTEISGLSLDQQTFENAQNLSNETYANTAIGGNLFRKKGEVLNFDALGKVYFQGYRLGDYTLRGKLSTTFGTLDSLLFWGEVDFSRSTPDRFMQHYYSNHFWWDNNFDARFEEIIKAGIEFPKFNMKASLKMSTVNNYIYFDRTAQAKQFSPGIQLASVEFQKVFNMGQWVWDTQVAYQLTSNDTIVPLPDISVYSNLFYYNTFSKVLHFQFGTNVHYHTAYNALAYMPAIGRFHIQDEVEIGNYPLVDVYANFHIKRMRFFLMYKHVNYGLLSREYFSAPHYAFNQRFFKIGVSWNFYD